LINETNLSFVHGSVFGIKRSQVKLLDDSGKVLKEIVLSSNNQGDQAKANTTANKKDADQYQVMGIEDEGNSRVNAVLTRQLIPQTL
jgi:hypothetical protein